MEDSFEILSTMSPKLTKVKRIKRKVPAILSLKKPLRRSSVLDKCKRIDKNESLILIENSTDTTSSSSCDNLVKNKLRNSQKSTSPKSKNHVLNTSPIVISDSEVSDCDIKGESEICANYTNEKTKSAADCENINLVYTKFNAIADWVSKVNSECQYIQETSKESLSDNNRSIYEQSLNSRKLNQLIKSKCSKKEQSENGKSCSEANNQSVRFNDSCTCVEDSFKLHILDTTDCGTEEAYNKQVTVTVNEDNDSCLSNSRESFKTCVSSNNSVTRILDDLYGKYWRKNKNNILSKTEPKQRNKNGIFNSNAVCFTQVKNKTEFSPIYKNPYLTPTEISPQNNLKPQIEPAWSKSVKKICDSDSSDFSENINLLPRTRLNFDDLENDFSIQQKSKAEEDNSEDKLQKLLFNADNRCLFNSNLKDLKNTFQEKTGRNLNIKSEFSNVTSEKYNKKYNNIDTKETLAFSDSSENFSDTEQKTLEDRLREKLGYNLNSFKNVKNNNDTNAKKDNKQQKDNIRKQTVGGQNVNKKKTINSKSKTKITKNEINTKTVYTSSSSLKSNKEKEKLKENNQNLDNIVLKNYSEGKRETTTFLASLSASIPMYRCDPSALIFRNNFKMFKDKLVEKLFALYNEKVFDGAIPSDTPVQWNDRMRGTAGFCYCVKVTKSTGQIIRKVRITLSTKVLDSADRVRDTLIHEMCHAGSWIVSGISDGHGPQWTAWAQKAMQTFPELPPIKVCHNYVINTKYTYRCTYCGYSIGRHTKSLDIERKRCGYCYGTFEVFINKKNKVGEVQTMPITPKKEATGFALFVKNNYALYKTPQLNHGKVMKILGEKFSEMKIKSTK